MKYPKTVAAVKLAEQNTERLIDAMIEELAPIGVNTEDILDVGYGGDKRALYRIAMVIAHWSRGNPERCKQGLELIRHLSDRYIPDMEL